MIKIYKCLYCGDFPFTSTDKDKIKRHEEYLHGCFRDINPRGGERSPYKHKDLEWEIKLPSEEEIEIDIYGHYQPLVWINDNDIATLRYFVKCNICDSTLSIDSSPEKRKKTLSSKGLMLCPMCGKNIFSEDELERKKMIKIYTLDGCEDCKKLKKFLDKHKLTYIEVNIGKPGHIDIKKRMKEEKFNRVPILEVNGKLIDGHILSKVKEELELND